MSLRMLIEEQAELKQMLASIVDSAGLSDLTEEVRAGMMEELAKLLEDKMFQYFVSNLDEAGFEAFKNFLETQPEEKALAAKLKELCPNYEKDLHQVFVDFEKEYAV